jgi:hypothetical protein
LSDEELIQKLALDAATLGFHPEGIGSLLAMIMPAALTGTFRSRAV